MWSASTAEIGAASGAATTNHFDNHRSTIAIHQSNRKCRKQTRNACIATRLSQSRPTLRATLRLSKKNLLGLVGSQRRLPVAKWARLAGRTHLASEQERDMCQKISRRQTLRWAVAAGGAALSVPLASSTAQAGICTKCSGAGWYFRGFSRRTCDRCGGDGQVEQGGFGGLHRLQDQQIRPQEQRRSGWLGPDHGLGHRHFGDRCLAWCRRRRCIRLFGQPCGVLRLGGTLD